MKFTTDDGQEISWFDGMITGSDQLVSAVNMALIGNIPCAFEYWGEQTADISTEFRAYLTIGATLNRLGYQPTVDLIPDNPDGYAPEGPIFPTTLQRLTAALESR